jgi:hypothetical protein
VDLFDEQIFDPAIFETGTEAEPSTTPGPTGIATSQTPTGIAATPTPSGTATAPVPQH